jgi:hypothetical protein
LPLVSALPRTTRFLVLQLGAHGDAHHPTHNSGQREFFCRAHL